MAYMPCTNPHCGNSRKTPEQLCPKCQAQVNAGIKAKAKVDAEIKAKAKAKAAKPVDK